MHREREPTAHRTPPTGFVDRLSIMGVCCSLLVGCWLGGSLSAVAGEAPRAPAPATNQTQETAWVSQEIRYRLPESAEVFVVWGINGWQNVPESLRPPGTFVTNRLMHSPMARRSDSYRAALPAPNGATINFLFLITKSGARGPVRLWDLNGVPEMDFHTGASPGGVTEIRPTIMVDRRQPLGLPLSANQRWAVAGAIMLILALAIGRHLQRVTQSRALRLSLGVVPFRRRWIYLRDLLRELVAREMKIQYKRSALGIAWSLANPLLQLLVFGFVFKFILAVAVPKYSAYAFTGMLVWSWFQMSLAQGARSITANRDLVRRPGFPSAILPVAAVTTNFVQFMLAFPILILFLLLTRSQLGLSVVALPLVIACQFVFMLSVSYLLAAVNVVFQDTQHILGVVLQMLLFLTPIFYDVKAIPAAFRPLHQLNPLGQLVDAYRAILIQGAWPGAMPLAALSLVGALLLYFTYQLFMRMSHRFAEEA